MRKSVNWCGRVNLRLSVNVGSPRDRPVRDEMEPRDQPAETTRKGMPGTEPEGGMPPGSGDQPSE